MNKLGTAFLASAAIAAIAAPAAAADTSALEQRFDSMISATDQQQWLQQMASAPNHVGSPHDKANAEMQLALFKQWGWDAHIEQFDVLYPTPISTTLELVAPDHVVLGGQEPPVPEDPTSTVAGALPMIMTRSSSAESASRARSSSPATAKAGAG
jgi:N-acetylated-alpha-linked acidic dipeptidase